MSQNLSFKRMYRSGQALADSFLRSQLAKDITWLYCIYFLNYLVPLLMIPYLARVLGAKEWGVLSFTLSFSSFVNVITEYGFYVSGQREAAHSQHDKQALSRLFNEVLCAKLLIACLVIIVAFIVSRFILILRDSTELLLGALCLGITQAFSPAWYFRGTQRIKLAAGMEAAAKGIGVGLVVFSVRTPADTWKYFYAFAASQLGVLIWGFWCASRDITLRIPAFVDGIRAVRRASPIFLLHAVGSIFTTSSVFVLGLLAQPHIVGYYAGAEKIVRFLASTMEPVRHAMFPRLSYLVHHNREEARRQVNRVLVATGSISVCISCLVYLFAPELMTLVLGNDFSPATTCLQILALIIFISTLNAGLGFMWMLPRGFERACLLTIAAVFLLNLILALILVPMLQHVGMAVAMVASECVIFVGFWKTFVRD